MRDVNVSTYRDGAGFEWSPGKFHQWLSCNDMAVGVVELESGRIVVRSYENIVFLPERPIKAKKATPKS